MGKWMRGWRGWLLLIALTVLASGGVSVWQVFVQGIADGTTQQLTTGELIMKLTGLPIMLAAGMLFISTAWASVTGDVAKAQEKQLALQQEKDAAERAQKEAQDKAKHTFAAQVVGLQWLDPLMWKDYPTEWNLLWTLGVAKWNKDDLQVKEDPASYSKVQPVGAFGDGSTDTPVDAIFRLHLREVGYKLRERYFMNPKYFYTVQPRSPQAWRELAGIRIHLAIPSRIAAHEAQSFVRDTYHRQFSIGKIEDKLSTSDTPPDVHVTQGDPSVGFASLSDALDYLEAHPDKTVWVMSFDAPSYPAKANQMNESSVLLVLAHPSYKTEREPLAWLHRVSTRPARDFEAGSGKSSRIVQAWGAALTDAAARGGVSPQQIGFVIHDAGVGSPDGGQRIGTLGQALTETMPELDFQRQTFDTPALLGDLGASSALTNIALGIAYAHHKNTPVIVAGTSAPASATAVLIRPPAHPKPFDPNKNWFRARGEGNAYLPWWGRRLDEKRAMMQGWSE